MHSGMVSKLFSDRKRISSDDRTFKQLGNVVKRLLFRSSNFKCLNCPHKAVVWSVASQIGLDDRSSSVASVLSSSNLSDILLYYLVRMAFVFKNFSVSSHADALLRRDHFKIKE
jgi:hypothetical protein